ncbi:transcriptional regulator [Halovibrio variabilis]|uniref:Transcriptional regulator n=1 Tax=Halovibrio variabilis TaxID=31910 RepID=A0A511USZ7_9GAMM|nr:transcriptional regulator [Halovibrio variabilis]
MEDNVLSYFVNHVAPWVNCYPAGSMIEPHSHDVLQILYASSGSMLVRTNGLACIVNPGRAALIPPGVEHQVHMNSQADMATLYVSGLKQAMCLDEASSVTVSPIIKQLLLTAIARSASPSFSPVRSVHLLGLLFEEIYNGDSWAPSISFPQDQRASRVCEKVLADPAEGNTLESLARQAGASSRTISRIFRRELGLSFLEWRQQVQIIIAINALDLGQPVSKIAFELGYSSISAFSSAFRKQVGCPPSAYARKGEMITS